MQGLDKMPQKLKTPLICVCALILNFVSVYLFQFVLGTPLFMDTIFTVAVVFLYGLVPALCVSVAYNILNPVFIRFVVGLDFVPAQMIYVFCGIGIVIITWAVARKKENFRISVAITSLYLLLISLSTSFYTVFVGGTIDFFNWKNSSLTEFLKPFVRAFINQKFNLYISCILAQIPISITDRIINTFAGFCVYKIFDKCTSSLRRMK